MWLSLDNWVNSYSIYDKFWLLSNCELTKNWICSSSLAHHSSRGGNISIRMQLMYSSHTNSSLGFPLFLLLSCLHRVFYVILIYVVCICYCYYFVCSTVTFNILFILISLSILSENANKEFYLNFSKEMQFF